MINDLLSLLAIIEQKPGALLMNKTPMELFIVGGVIMWPMIFLSFVALTVTIERVIFGVVESTKRRRQHVQQIMDFISRGQFDEAVAVAKKSPDFVARILGEAIEHRGGSMEDAFGRAASEELARYGVGLPVLDTAVTSAPLLGLLGTVTGMMQAFGAVEGGIDPQVITAGIAEALVATASGLFIAIVCLLPFNWVNTMLEDARREVEETGHALELTLRHAGFDVGSFSAAAPKGDKPAGGAQSAPARA